MPIRNSTSRKYTIAAASSIAIAEVNTKNATVIGISISSGRNEKPRM